MRGNPAAHFTTADHRGAFLLQGLIPHEKYFLLSAGAGFATPRSQSGLRPPADGLVVFVRPAYGAAVRIVQEDNGEPLTPNKVGFDESVTGFPEGIEPITSIYARQILALSGVPSRLLADQVIRLQGFTTQKEAPSFDYIYSAHFPGFLPEERTLTASRLTSHLVVQELRLTSVATGFGTLNLFLDPALHDGSAMSRVTPVGTLTMRPIEPNRRTLTIPLSSILSGTETISGIPYGTYKLSMHLRNGGFTYPPHGGSVDVQISQTPRDIRVSSEGLGALSASIYQDGVEFRGAIKLMIGDSHHVDAEGRAVIDHGGSVSFERPPYTIYGLRPGNYTLVLASPTSHSTVLQLESVSVGPGETTVASFEL